MFKLILVGLLLGLSNISTAHSQSPVTQTGRIGCEDALIGTTSSPTKENPAVDFYHAADGRIMPYKIFEPNSVVRHTEFTHLTIHGLGDDVNSFDDYNREWSRAGYLSVSMGLHGSHLELLRLEEEQNGSLRSAYSFQNNVDDIVSFILSHNLKRVAISGHSMGAAVGAGVAAALKSKGVEVALIYGAGYLNFKAFTRISEAKKPVSLARAEEMLKIMLKLWYDRHYVGANEKRTVPYTTSDIKLLVEAAMAMTLGARDVDMVDSSLLTSQLKGIPVSVVTGTEDKVVLRNRMPDFQASLRSLGVRVEVKDIDGADHALYQEHPDQMFSLAQEFFTRHFQAKRPWSNFLPFRRK